MAEPLCHDCGISLSEHPSASCLDAWAGRLAGLPPECPKPSYSSYLPDAMGLIAHDKKHAYTLQCYPDGNYAAVKVQDFCACPLSVEEMLRDHPDYLDTVVVVQAKTLPLAIVRAFILGWMRRPPMTDSAHREQVEAAQKAEEQPVGVAEAAEGPIEAPKPIMTTDGSWVCPVCSPLGCPTTLVILTGDPERDGLQCPKCGIAWSVGFMANLMEPAGPKDIIQFQLGIHETIPGALLLVFGDMEMPMDRELAARIAAWIQFWLATETLPLDSFRRTKPLQAKDGSVVPVSCRSLGQTVAPQPVTEKLTACGDCEHYYEPTSEALMKEPFLERHQCRRGLSPDTNNADGKCRFFMANLMGEPASASEKLTACRDCGWVSSEQVAGNAMCHWEFDPMSGTAKRRENGYYARELNTDGHCPHFIPKVP